MAGQNGYQFLVVSQLVTGVEIVSHWMAGD
jgi:hypothetical protein